MNILVVNGSPKGKFSITFQTVLFLEKHFPKHHFHVLHAGQRIRALGRDFTQARKDLEEADLILFSYPVYTFIAPSQLQGFIRLMKESGVDLTGKFVTQITTSKHFYDVTAHRYIMENCQDMGMKYIQGLSADMDDLLEEKGQKEALEFFHYVLWSMKHDSYEPLPEKAPEPKHLPVHVPEEAPQKPAFKGKDVVIVADLAEGDTQLQNMIQRFQRVLPVKSHVVNIREYPFAGGCLGCFHCAVSGECVYRDGFDEFLRNEIQTGAAIVYAFSIQDHSMGVLFKQYDDRQFCNGHRTVTMGMPMGYLISGDYSRETNLQMIIEGRAEVGGNFLAGTACDEKDPDGTIDRMAETLLFALKHHYLPPQNFYGVGGRKIFRDLVYLMQGMMKADHAFYKAHGQYDFPQKEKGTLIKMYMVGLLLSSPKVYSKMGNMMNEGMLMPYKKVLEKN